MGLRVESRVLPGIGVCQELELHDGRRVGIVTRRDGHRDFVVYDEDGDGRGATITFDEKEADVIAELLGAPQLVNRLADLQRSADEVLTEQLPIPRHSPLRRAPARRHPGAHPHRRVHRRGAARRLDASPRPARTSVSPRATSWSRWARAAGLDQVARILDGTSPPGSG